MRKEKMKLPICMVAMASFGMGFASNGAGFVNLDFDEGDLSKTVFVDAGFTRVGNMTYILPGWMIQSGDLEPVDSVQLWVNMDYFSVEAFGLYDKTYWRNLPLEGQAAFLAAPSPANEGKNRVSLLQTGIVPTEARSLRYECLNGAFEVWLDGTRLPLVDLEREAAGVDRLREVSADISAWAGKEVDLKLTQELGIRWSALDSIRFSPEPVIPEPSKQGVFIVGAAVLGLIGPGWRRGQVLPRTD